MEPLEVLREGNRVIIGRKESVFRKEGFRTSLYIGKIEEENFYGYDVYLDALHPHVIFVAGARGSGKSYTLGVLLEELAENNPYVGVLVIDPIGIFWSMKLPNRQEEEIEKLAEWGLLPRGYDVEVYVPVGVEGRVPAGTYDKVFALKPSMLTAEDWILTFGLDRFSPAALLIDKVISHLRGQGDFSIDDIIHYLEGEDVLDRSHGFKRETVRAVLSRFYAARSWGIFDKEGTPLSEIIKKGKISILDISFLDENVGALVIGVMARRILQARKLITRSVAAELLDLPVSKKKEIDIPPVWLFIDEAHTLIPSGTKKTPATEPLIEYVKQGRRPGCSLVFATQQPSAIDPRVLSQIDLLIVHKLVFGEDVKAVEKRMPTILPKEYSGVKMRRLPVGVAIVGDRSDATSRAFIMRVRPRKSQHEGREVAVDELEEEEKVVERGEERGEERGREMAFTVRISREDAEEIAKSHVGGFLGRVFGAAVVESVVLKFVPVWEVLFTYYSHTAQNLVCYIDSYEGEFVHVKDGKLVFSKGLKYLYRLTRGQRRLLVTVKNNIGLEVEALRLLAKLPTFDADLDALRRAGLVRIEGGRVFTPLEIDLPLVPDHPLVPSLRELPRAPVELSQDEIISPVFDKERAPDIVRSIWPGVVPKDVYTIYRPVWFVTVRGRKHVRLIIDALTGSVEKEMPVV